MVAVSSFAVPGSVPSSPKLRSSTRAMSVVGPVPSIVPVSTWSSTFFQNSPALIGLLPVPAVRSTTSMATE